MPAFACGCSLLFGIDSATYAGDSAPPRDASGDLHPQSDQPGIDGGWCARSDASAFCDDFDRETPIAFSWAVHATDTASIEEDTRTYFSAPRAFLSELSPDADGVYAQLTQALPGKWHEAHVEMAIRIGDLDGGFTSDMIAIASWSTQPNTGSNDPDGCVYMFRTNAQAAQVQVQSFDGKRDHSYDMLRFPIAGLWGNWRISLSGDDTGVTISMQLDDASALEPTHLDICRMGGDVHVDPGFFYARGPAQARFDNVRVDVR
jgi:hypothetical protein